MELMETIQASFDYQMRENPMGQAREDACRQVVDNEMKSWYYMYRSASKKVSNRGGARFMKLNEISRIIGFGD
jgi:hypothetical protein